MSSNIEQAVVERLRVLSVEQQQQVLKFAEQLEQQSASGTTANDNSLPIWEVIEKMNSEAPPETWDDVPTESPSTIWEEIRRISAEAPDEVWEQLPRDGAEQLDYYLYGSPKK